LPLPSYLPEGYNVQEIYIGGDNHSIVLLISDKPIEKIERDPPDELKDYPINLVKSKMIMFVSFEHDLRIVGRKAKPTPIPIEFREMHDGTLIVYGSVDKEGNIASVQIIAKKDVTDKEEIIKIIESMS
jgi:hypothetical protein